MIITLFAVVPQGITEVKAASYPKVELKVPWFCQRRYADCGIASISMVEAYKKGYSTNSDVVYNTVYNYNNKSVTLSSYANLGYTTISNSLSDIYEQLKKDNPVIVYRTGSNHYSVIYGYNGSSSKLEKSGFLVLNTYHYDKNDYRIFDNPGSIGKTNLSKWLSGNSWKHTLVKTSNKIPLEDKKIVTTPSTPKLTYNKKELLLGETSVISWADCGVGVTYTVDIKQGDNNIYNGKPSGTLKHSFVPQNEGKYKITVTAKSANGKTASGKLDIICSSKVTADLDGDGIISSDDAIYLVKYTMLPENYPVTTDVDFDKNGQINSDDAVYLLKYTMLPEQYPIN